MPRTCAAVGAVAASGRRFRRLPEPLAAAPRAHWLAIVASLTSCAGVRACGVARDSIEQQIWQQQQQRETEVKILLLGPGESGAPFFLLARPARAFGGRR